jgi:tetratricopeptide (TPR) repeat protein
MKQRLGRLEEVRAHADAALRLAPFDTALVAFSHLQAGFAEYYLGHDEAAYEHMRLSIAAGPSPSQVRARMLLASLDALHGRGQEAREHAAELLRLRPRFSIGTWRVWTAPVHPRLQALRERFLEGLAKAGLPE